MQVIRAEIPELKASADRLAIGTACASRCAHSATSYGTCPAFDAINIAVLGQNADHDQGC